MCQMRLTSLGTLVVESELAKQLDFNEIIETFANKKARKAAVGTPFICAYCMFMFIFFFLTECLRNFSPKIFGACRQL